MQSLSVMFKFSIELLPHGVRGGPLPSCCLCMFVKQRSQRPEQSLILSVLSDSVDLLFLITQSRNTTKFINIKLSA